MSVLFATITHDFAVLCADKMCTNEKTGEINTVTKIEQWSPSIAVGGTGSAMLDELVISGVREHVKEKGLDSFTLEEIADLFGQCYYATREVYADMPEDTQANFVLVGRLSNGNSGAIQVSVGKDEADAEIIEAKNTPATLILAPSDVTDEECNHLFQKAALNSRKKNTYQRDLLEVAHRKAVRYVSERSKFVSPQSDYIFINLT